MKRPLPRHVPRTRVIGVAMLALTIAMLLVAAACLPDLTAFPAGPDAAEPDATSASLVCGDGVIETLEDGGDAGESCDPGDAQAPGCVSCQITCDGGAIDEGGHCYFMTSPTSTYAEAQSACAITGAHVATFASDREAAFATALVEDAGYAESGYWVGLDQQNALGQAYGPPRGVNEPGFPNGESECSGCFGLGDDGGTFAPLPGDAGTTGRQCLVALKGAWWKASCQGEQVFATLCEREPLGERIYPCGGLLCTTVPITAGRKRYVLWQFPQTADRANELCRTSYDGGSLVILDSNEEREQLVREVVARLQSPSSSDPLDVWIGLALEDGIWKWEDGTAADAGTRPLPWGKDQPGAGSGRAFLRVAPANALTFDTQLAQADDDASIPRVFVCQRPVE